MREILFIQMGNLSNYVMTHFWNLSDEIVKSEMEDFEFEKLYSESLKKANTFIPRTLILDKKNLFSHMAQELQLEESKQEENL
jgi:hypothetical protein